MSYGHLLYGFPDPNEDTCLLTQLGSGPDAKEQQYYR